MDPVCLKRASILECSKALRAIVNLTIYTNCSILLAATGCPQQKFTCKVSAYVRSFLLTMSGAYSLKAKHFAKINGRIH